MNLKLPALIAVSLLMSCGMIDYHPYDTRVNADTNINQTQITRIKIATQGKDTIRFAMIGDTQLYYDETVDFVKHINKRTDIDFIIHGGDMTEFGMKREYEWSYEIMSKLKPPFIALIGNHDIIGNGDRIYKKMYGDANFAFIAGCTKFVCLNTNAIEYNSPVGIPDFNFIKNELMDSTTHTKTVVVMHSPPGSEQFNNNTNAFHEYIKRFPSLQFCLHAHYHYISVANIFNDGILYYGCSNIAKHTYLCYTLTSDGYKYEVVDF